MHPVRMEIFILALLAVSPSFMRRYPVLLLELAKEITAMHAKLDRDMSCEGCVSIAGQTGDKDTHKNVCQHCRRDHWEVKSDFFTLRNQAEKDNPKPARTYLSPSVGVVEAFEAVSVYMGDTSYNILGTIHGSSIMGERRDLANNLFSHVYDFSRDMFNLFRYFPIGKNKYLEVTFTAEH